MAPQTSQAAGFTRRSRIAASYPVPSVCGAASKLEIPENAGPIGTLMLLSVDWGFNALGMYLKYQAAAKALAICKYLADPHAHVEGGIPAAGP